MFTDLPIWLIAVVVAGLALVLVLTLQWLFRGSKKEIDRRLGSDADGDSDGHDSKGDHAALVLQRPLRPGEQSGRGAFDANFERMILRTGLDLSPGQALALTALFGVVLFAALHLWREELWLSILGLVVGMGVPLAAFWFLQSRYRTRMQHQLPDCLFLLARSLRAGMSLEQALELLGERGVKPLADEFERCNGQIRLGFTIPAALQSMALRLQLLDFNAFVSTISYYQSTGGNLPLLLDRLATSSRDRNQFRGQFLALTAQARITAIALGLAPILLLGGYALFEPEHVRRFFQSLSGWMVIACAFALQLVGVFWLYRLVRVEY